MYLQFFEYDTNHVSDPTDNWTGPKDDETERRALKIDQILKVRDRNSCKNRTSLKFKHSHLNLTSLLVPKEDGTSPKASVLKVNIFKL